LGLLYHSRRFQKWIGYDQEAKDGILQGLYPLSPRPLWLECHADEATQGELEGKFY